MRQTGMEGALDDTGGLTGLLGQFLPFRAEPAEGRADVVDFLLQGAELLALGQVPVNQIGQLAFSPQVGAIAKGDPVADRGEIVDVGKIDRLRRRSFRRLTSPRRRPGREHKFPIQRRMGGGALNPDLLFQNRFCVSG